MDTSWSALQHYWERVRWARLQWQERTGTDSTARSAAESLGMDENTYTTYERRPRSTKEFLDVAMARKFAQRFKVSWVWLSSGEGTPFDADRGRYSPEAAEVADIVEDREPAERAEVAAAIKALLKRTGT